MYVYCEPSFDERLMILGLLFLLGIVIPNKRGFRLNRMLLFSLNATFWMFHASI